MTLPQTERPPSWAVWALGLAVPAALLPDLVAGSPSGLRIGLCLGLGLLVALSHRLPADRAERAPWGVMLAVTLTLAWIGLSGVSALKYAHFGDILARDTAYYDQIYRSVVEGHGWKGSILHTLYHDPPLRSHWAIHFTPIAWILTPIYALIPKVETLLVARNAFIILACWPMYLLARRRLGRAPAFVLALALLATPTMLYQPLNSFYFYGAAVAPCLWAWYFHEEGRPILFLVACAAMLTVREDMGIAVAALGVVALLDRWKMRRADPELPVIPLWPYAAAIVGGAVWWIGVVKHVMPRYGQASGDATAAWFAGWGSGPGEMVKTLLTKPSVAAGILLTQHKLTYLWGLVRSCGFLGLGGLPLLVGLPYVAINMLVTRPGAATADLTYHYSLMIVAALYMTLPRAIASMAGTDPRRRLTLSVFVLAMSLSAVTSVFSAEQIQILKGGPEVAAIERILSKIPDDGTSVAAPSRFLPALTRHKNLVASDKPMGYQTTRHDWVILAEKPGTYHPADWPRTTWEVYFETFRSSPSYKLVYKEAGYAVYRRIAADPP